MKKIWLVLVLLFGVLTVSGCQTQLDETDQKVDKSIDQFLTEHVTTYMNNEFVNESVLASIYHLDPNDKLKILDEYLNQDMTFARDTAYSLINALVYESVLDMDKSSSKNVLLSKTTDNPYEATSLLHAAYMANVTGELVDAYKNVILNTDSSLMDADYAGMAMLALSPYKDEDNVKTYMDDLKDLIVSYLSKDGVISWGNPNSSTTATVIIGLLSIGENPRDEAYTVEDVDLIEALLLYESNGAFKWMMNDEIDLMFSTPQGFTALALYQVYRKEGKPIYLYDLTN